MPTLFPVHAILVKVHEMAQVSSFQYASTPLFLVILVQAIYTNFLTVSIY